jgi:hypothetical protein
MNTDKRIVPINAPDAFHMIGVGATPWSQAPGNLGDYFTLTRKTWVVVAPGSDMPYCLVRWYPDLASAVGWPAQAANPAAFVPLNDQYQEADCDRAGVITNHPILLSHKPKLLKPGIYVPALPQMAYYGYGQYDLDHVWPTLAFKYPHVLLSESEEAVEQNPYQFVTPERDAEGAENYYTPWLITPDDGVGYSSGTYSKLLGVGGSNRQTDPQVVATFYAYTKPLTFPDTAAVRNTVDVNAIATLAINTRLNTPVERFSWFKMRLNFTDETGYTPEGVGYIIR